MSMYQSIKNVGKKALIVGGLVAILSGCGNQKRGMRTSSNKPDERFEGYSSLVVLKEFSGRQWDITNGVLRPSYNFNETKEIVKECFSEMGYENLRWSKKKENMLDVYAEKNGEVAEARIVKKAGHYTYGVLTKNHNLEKSGNIYTMLRLKYDIFASENMLKKDISSERREELEHKLQISKELYDRIRLSVD